MRFAGAAHRVHVRVRKQDDVAGFERYGVTGAQRDPAAAFGDNVKEHQLARARCEHARQLRRLGVASDQGADSSPRNISAADRRTTRSRSDNTSIGCAAAEGGLDTLVARASERP